MKLSAIAGGGRKKDFWDMHMLLDFHSLSECLEYYKARSPWEFDRSSILRKMRDYSLADTCLDPVCLMLKQWEDIKLDIIDKVRDLEALE